jgi:D-3-phosphoglycerate dehydrogenase
VSKHEVLLLENIHPAATEVFEREGFVVHTRSGSLGEDDLIEALQGMSMVGIRSNTNVTEKVLASAPDLLAVGAFCIGTNQIDLDAAAQRGIAAFNAPYSNTRSVVELVIGEIIALARRLPEKTQRMHDGIWDKSAQGSHEVRGRTLGIVGYGNIGTQLGNMAESLGFRVLFYDTADRLAHGNARRVGSLDELLEQSDVVSLHVDGRPGNAGFFGAEQFAKMRPGSIFLNLSRGIVVDHGSLRAALESEHISGAAVDVFPTEPKGRGDEFVSELRGLPNVILTPHIGGSTEEAQSDIGDFVANKLVHFIEEGNTTLSVNLPSVALPAHPGMSRVVHVHINTPGVLAQVNSILAEHHVNVEGQLLSTRGEYGYLITDISGGYSDDVLDKLRAMSQTVRLRVLS